ncbi:MAG: hypothetical protein EOM20_00050 [Spartobacteria bacterium]|nr:hypothetical protein [Spartobacteria bacterium]
MISKAKNIWFVHSQYEPPMPLCLQRREGLGAHIDGGKTGPHSTGHGETYWDAFRETVQLGYIPVDVAKEIGALDMNWNPPTIEELNKNIKKRVYQLKANV